jgi:hypothetical protein
VASVERFSGRFASYWNAVLPRLDHFVRLSNLGPDRLAPQLIVHFAAERQALVSETGFMLWASFLRGQRTNVDAASELARQRLESLVFEGYLLPPLSRDERAMATEIGRRLRSYGREHADLRDCEVEPHLPGCGVIGGGVPDLVANDHARPGAPTVLVEVKSVDRSFRSTDFRQLVCYTVLYFAARHALPDALYIVNPLRGTATEVGVSTFFEDVAGASADDVVHRLATEWSDWATPSP